MKRWIGTALVASTTALTVAITGGSASAASPVRDPERYSSTGTGWGYFLSDEPGIDTWLNTTNTRAFDVEKLLTGGFSVVGVINSGQFQRTPAGSSSWTSGETAASLASKISSSALRLLDIERYTENGQTRFAATWVQNTGVAAKGWFYWLNQSLAQVTAHLTDCGCRLVDLDPIGSGRYDAVMIPNTGVDALAWFYYVGLTQTQVFQALADTNARAVDVEPDDNGRYSLVSVRDGLSGQVRFDQTFPPTIAAGQRLIHLKQYRNPSAEFRLITVSLQNG